MNDQLKQFIEAAMGGGPLVAPNSRYAHVGIATMESVDGREVRYLRRRFLPQPERLELLREHSVREGDRLDLLAAVYIGDPEQFWRICDANRAMRPDELTETPGRRLRIAVPDGREVLDG